MTNEYCYSANTTEEMSGIINNVDNDDDEDDDDDIHCPK